MIFRRIKIAYPKLIFFMLMCTFPLLGNSTVEEVISEKRIKLAMRMIGHETLLCLGDNTSRVMPIEKINEQYRISFESELKFGFNPDDIISTVERVMAENNIPSNYFVEVEECKSKAVVYSFEVGKAGLIPCRGRIVPENCYRFLITVIVDLPTKQVTFDDSSLFISADRQLFLLPVIAITLLLGLFIYIIYLKKKRTVTDPNLILIGASQFNKKNRALSFKNNSIDLSNKEAELLSLLHTSANEPIAREIILQSVWGDEGDYIGRTLDVFISKLRKKLAADTSVKIVNIRGVGYKLVME